MHAIFMVPTCKTNRPTNKEAKNETQEKNEKKKKCCENYVNAAVNGKNYEKYTKYKDKGIHDLAEIEMNLYVRNITF